MGVTKKSSARDGKPKTQVNAPSKKELGRLATVGAPAQPTQSSRKGKRAWRKNVDISTVEEGLEELREEERIIGAPMHTKSDDQLFTIDVTGDEKIRRNVKTKKPLTSAMILAQRSAVPAVFSRAPQAKKKDRVTKEEKERLLRIGKRKRSGPFGAAMDTREIGSGSALLEPSEAVKQSGTYDVWMEGTEETVEDAEFSVPKKMAPKPRIKPMHEMIAAAAISAPHQGTSYNPPVDSYQDLLITAVKVEERRLAEDQKYEAIKNKIVAARTTGGEAVEGMIIDIPGDDAHTGEEPEEGEADVVVPTRPARRKTQQQRRTALRIAQEKQSLKEKANQKKLLATLDRVKALRKDVENARTEQERIAAQRKLEKMEKLRKGLAGQRVGKHKVTEGEIDVQLGEDLSESLRLLKVEGNLFKDRLLSMQNRALVEPRSRVLPTRRKIKVQELEKFAWKRFT